MEWRGKFNKELITMLLIVVAGKVRVEIDGNYGDLLLPLNAGGSGNRHRNISSECAHGEYRSNGSDHPRYVQLSIGGDIDIHGGGGSLGCGFHESQIAIQSQTPNGGPILSCVWGCLDVPLGQMGLICFGDICVIFPGVS